MSLFVSDLAFDDEELLQAAKVGILAASVVSGVGGWLLLRAGPPCRSRGGYGAEVVAVVPVGAVVVVGVPDGAGPSARTRAAVRMVPSRVPRASTSSPAWRAARVAMASLRRT